MSGDSPSPSPSPSTGRTLATIARRELVTLWRTRTAIALVLGVAAILLGIGRVGAGAAGGYLPTIVDLVTPLELLVPILAVALGYRAIIDDANRGELELLGTYPLAPWQLVLGTFLGRAAGLVAAVVVPLVAVMAMIAASAGPEISLFATHAGADSPVRFLRLIALTALFALVVLALALAVSAVATTTRGALVLAGLVLLVLLVGGDLAVLSGLAGDRLGDDALGWALALSPNSAYRGLVLETAVGVAVDAGGAGGPRAAAPLASLLGLLLWGVGGLAVALVGVRRS